MRWALDPEQVMLQEAISGWLERAASPEKVRGWAQQGDSQAFESSLAEEGWLAVGTSEERGGQGGGLLDVALVAEQLGRVNAPSSSWLATVLALPALAPDVAAALIEEGGFAAIAVTGDAPITAGAVTVGSGMLSGEVPMVLGGDRAGVLVVPAGGRLYSVDAGASGVTVTPIRLLDRSRTAASVRLDSARGTELDVEADAVLATAASRAAVLVAADALGSASRMLELAVEYSLQRTQFGQPIGSFQAVKHTAATMLVNQEATRSIVYYAAESVENALQEAAQHAAVAKAQGTRAAVDAAEGALTIHGAIGYTWEHDLQLFYKRVKLDLALYGAPAVWNERIATALDLV